MIDLFWLLLENLGRRLMEVAARRREVYALRSVQEVVKEAWAPTAPEIRS